VARRRERGTPVPRVPAVAALAIGSALVAACATDGAGVRVDFVPNRFGPVARSSSVPTVGFDEVPATLPETSVTGFHMLARISSGYLAFGFDTESGNEERSALWRSNDLRTWERTGRSLGAVSGRQEVAAVASIGGSLIAVGTQRDELGAAASERAKAWYSDDGGDLWTPASIDGLELQPSELIGVVNAGGRAVAIGSIQASGELRDAVVLTTEDGGRTWSRRGLSHANGISFLPAAVVADGVEVLVTGRREDPAAGSSVAMVWRSTDGGATWYTEDLPGGTFSGPSVLDHDQSIVLGGTNAETLAWTSDEGGPWRLVRSAAFARPAPASVRPSAITRHGQCLFAIGVAADQGQAFPEADDLAWRSCDNGATWVDLGYTAPIEQKLRANEGIASTPVGVVIVGWTFDQSHQRARLTRIVSLRDTDA
jgi:hypothetical protein